MVDKQTKAPSFPSFYYDCNEGWGPIGSAGPLGALISRIRVGRSFDLPNAVKHLLSGTCLGPPLLEDERHPRNTPTFGWRFEHIGGEITLAQWLVSKGWVLVAELFESSVRVELRPLHDQCRRCHCLRELSIEAVGMLCSDSRQLLTGEAPQACYGFEPAGGPLSDISKSAAAWVRRGGTW